MAALVPLSKPLQWVPDKDTAVAATAALKPPVLFPSQIIKALQFGGRSFNTQKKIHRITLPARWIKGCDLISSPENIIIHFQRGAFLEALAMVVSWGTMWRRSKRIYNRSLPLIYSTLKQCYASIQTTRSIQSSWVSLTGAGPKHLGWSAVMASKTLHFMSRAAGFHTHPPVPLDNAVIRKCVFGQFLLIQFPLLMASSFLWTGKEIHLMPTIGI